MSQATSYGFVWENGYRGSPMLVNATARTALTGWVSKKNINKCWVFDYSISHYGRYKVGSRSQPWRERPPRIGHLYPPGVPYTEDLAGISGPIEDAWVIFTGGEQAGLDRLVPRGHIYARFVDPGGACQLLLQKTVLIAKTEGQAGFWRAQAAFCELLSLLLAAKHVAHASYEIVSPDSRPARSPWAEGVHEFLRAQCARPMRLEEIARKFNVSVSTLCHRYQSETGESPMGARMRLRIAQAKNLLLKGQTLKAVAAETGFCDPYHLSKAFKQVAGLSPRQFIGSLAGKPDRLADNSGKF